MPIIEGRYLERDFELFAMTTSVAEARRRLAGGRYGIIVDASGAPLACLRRVMLRDWPDPQSLEAMRERWPIRCTLSEAEAMTVAAVARFFEDDLFDHQDLPGIVLVDRQGKPKAIVRRRTLMEALADTEGTRYAFSKGVGESTARSERDLMVTRYSRLQFPAQPPIQERCSLAVTIHREQVSGAPGQVELGLTARQWPLKVTASLVGVRASDFLVEGPDSGVIEVPRTRDSDPLTFVLIPQSLGEKKVRVRFEQDNTYLGTAIIETEVVEPQAAQAGDAEVRHAPPLEAKGQPPDLTLYVERINDLQYAVRVRTCQDGPEIPAREMDRIVFEKPPDVYMEAIFADLNAKTAKGLSAEEFDAEVKTIGNNLYDKLFHQDRFKAYYWEQMYENPEVRTVQIVSDEPYIPWEILRPSRQKQDGTWESDPMFLCERFELSRWLEGPGPATKLPLRKVALVAPPSNLAYVKKEVEAIQGMAGLQVQIIQDRQALVQALEDPEADLDVLHFACHGRFHSDTPDRSVVVLGDRYLRPSDLVAERRNFGRRHPLVFLNACDSGRLGPGLTGLDGWSEAFLEAQVGFFVGSIWRTTDELASQLARVFYERLRAGDPVGEAMRRARDAVKQPGDATYLSYSLYANPRVRATRSVP